MLINEAVNLLGLRARDKIMGIEGIVTSACFDLYGCVQVTLHRGLDKDGKPHESFWIDVQRLELLPGSRIMPLPTFAGTIPTYDKGPAEKAPHGRTA